MTPLNPFFRQEVASEQRLVQDLVNEHLRMYGQEIYYMPRKFMGTDTIMRENVLARFEQAYPIEAYIANVDGFQGSGDLMSKFGIRVTDESTFIISKERYEDYVGELVSNIDSEELRRRGTDLTRPMEGDLVYFPLTDSLFEIKFVEHESPFYQLGQLCTYELRCELFEYEQEVFDTGIESIDDNAAQIGYVVTLTLAGTGVTATAGVGLNDGSVSKITLQNDGYGYSTVPTVAISTSPVGFLNANATAVAIGTIGSGSTTYSIQSIAILNPGYGYTQAPTVTITGNGSGAKARSEINDGVSYITAFTAGSEYSTTPVVSISTSPVGVATANAVAEATVSAAGTITSIRFSNAGFGYTQAPVLTIDTPYQKRKGLATIEIVKSTETYVATATTTGISTSVVGVATTVGTITSTPTDTITGIDTSVVQIGFGLTGIGISEGTVVTGIGSTNAADVVIVGLAMTVGVGSTTFVFTNVASTNISISTSVTRTAVTGIVTAINIIETGIGYTQAPTITISDPSGFNAGIITAGIATSGISTEIVSLNVAYGGAGYGITPSLTIAEPSGFNAGIITVGLSTIATLTGIATTSGTVSAGSTDVITGIVTTGIGIGDTISDSGSLVSAGTTVLSIGISSVTTSIGVGIGTTVFTFSRAIVTGFGDTISSITIADAGAYYATAPTLTISEPVSRQIGLGTTATATATIDPITGIINGVTITNPGAGYSSITDVITVTLTGGISTATGTALLNSVGVITGATITNSGFGYTTTPAVTLTGGITTATATAFINSVGIITGTSITNIGAGYTTLPTITLSEPSSAVNSGNFFLNEIITGQSGLATALVKDWNRTTRTLKIYSVAGDFREGEIIIGSATTVSTGNTSHITAAYFVEDVSYEDTDTIGVDSYESNTEIQDAATDVEGIVDWTETNPFGTF